MSYHVPHPAVSSMHEIMIDWTAVGKIQLMNSMQTDQVEAKLIGENNQRQGCTYQLLLQIISKTYNLLNNIKCPYMLHVI